MKNLGLKLWSLVIALLVSYYVHSEGNSGVITIVLPVELQNMPRHKVLVEPLAPQIQVTLRGPSYLLSDIASRPPTVKVTLPKSVEKDMAHHAVFQKKQLGLPPAVDVLAIQPAYMDFLFDNLAEKSIPVVVPRIGEVPQGYLLEKVFVTPRKVLIKGAQKELERVNSIETFPINLSVLKDSTEITLKLRAPDGSVQVSTDEVQVTLKVRSIKYEKKFNNLSIQPKFKNFQLGLNRKVVLSPPTVSIEISAPSEILKTLNSESLTPFVVIKESTSSGSFLKVRLRLPPKVDLVYIDPPEVKVKIVSNSSEKEKEINNSKS